MKPETSFIVRPATVDDILFLREMLFQSIFIPEGAQPVDRGILQLPSISKYVDDWGRAGDMGLIAINDAGMPVGSVTIRYFTGQNKGYGYVDDETPELGMAVVPEYRGKGIGTALLATMLGQAKLKGIQAISLSVHSDNPALRLYQKFGFQEVAIMDSAMTMVIYL